MVTGIYVIFLNFIDTPAVLLHCTVYVRVALSRGLYVYVTWISCLWCVLQKLQLHNY